MGIIDWLLGKSAVSPRQTADWDVYNKDFDNGMPWEEREAKLDVGGYEKGEAKISSNYGRIDDIEAYNKDVKRLGKMYAEIYRRNGFYMKKD